MNAITARRLAVQAAKEKARQDMNAVRSNRVVLDANGNIDINALIGARDEIKEIKEDAKSTVIDARQIAKNARGEANRIAREKAKELLAQKRARLAEAIKERRAAVMESIKNSRNAASNDKSTDAADAGTQ